VLDGCPPRPAGTGARFSAQEIASSSRSAAPQTRRSAVGRPASGLSFCLIHSTHIGIKRPKVQAHASECHRGCGRPLGVSALSDQLAAVAVTMGERLGSEDAGCSTLPIIRSWRCAVGRCGRRTEPPVLRRRRWRLRTGHVPAVWRLFRARAGGSGVAPVQRDGGGGQRGGGVGAKQCEAGPGGQEVAGRGEFGAADHGLPGGRWQVFGDVGLPRGR
jgi:hypothetical protein